MSTIKCVPVGTEAIIDGVCKHGTHIFHIHVSCTKPGSLDDLLGRIIEEEGKAGCKPVRITFDLALPQWGEDA